MSRAQTFNQSVYLPAAYKVINKDRAVLSKGNTPLDTGLDMKSRFEYAPFIYIIHIAVIAVNSI